MNDLSLFNPDETAKIKGVEGTVTPLKTKQLTSEAASQALTLTTAQVAETLHTSSKVILENARKCLPSKRIENGKPTFWTQEEITILLECLKNNSSNHASNLYFESKGSLSTDLTPALKIKKAMELMQEGYEEELAILRARNAEQAAQLTEQAPKVEMYNKLVDRSFCKCLRDTAQFIGEHEKHFLQVLQDKKVIYKHAGHYRAYADYADCFELKAYTYGENKTGQQLLVNIKGLELVKKIFKEV